MSMTDPISDLLVRIRNGAKAKHKAVDMPASNFKTSVAEIFNQLRFIKKYAVVNIDNKPVLRVWLRYNKNDESIISGMERISKPGLRVYASADDLFRMQQKVGYMIVSTSSGVMTHKQALKNKIGGEIICRIW